MQFLPLLAFPVMYRPTGSGQAIGLEAALNVIQMLRYATIPHRPRIPRIATN